MPESPLMRQLHKRHYLILLVTLLLVVVFHPIAWGRYGGQTLWTAFFSMVFLAAIFAVSRRRKLFYFAMVLGVFCMILSWVAYTVAEMSPSYANVMVLVRDINELLFLMFAIGVVLHDVLSGEEVTADRLCGAMCAFLMMGVAFATVYSIIELLQPNSFADLMLLVDPELNEFERRGEIFSALVYYSFVTLTTLGYGDITPVTPAARTFSWLEAATGQLYIAILIGRLVGLHIAHTVNRNREQA